MKDPKFYYKKYYYNTHRKRNKLGAKGLPESTINEKMGMLAELIVLNKDMMNWSKKYIHILKDREIDDMKKVTESRDNYFKKLDERKRRAKDALLDGIFTQSEYKEEIINLEKEEQGKRSEPEKINWFDKMNELTTIGEELKLVMIKGDVIQKRDILHRLQSNFVWNEENLNVINEKHVETLMTGLIDGKDEINVIEHQKSLVKQGDLTEMRDAFPTLCGWRESNSRPLVGSQIFYH